MHGVPSEHRWNTQGFGLRVVPWLQGSLTDFAMFAGRRKQSAQRTVGFLY